MRILVTGASGFLGHHLVQFLERRHEVAGCWQNHPVSFEHAESVRLDFTDPDACREMLARFSPTHVIHAGAMTHTGECENAPELARNVNVRGTENLLQALAGIRTASVPAHLVFISTDLVFNGRKPGGRYREEPLSEQDNPEPLMVYGRTKLEAEQLVAAAGTRDALTTTILRSALIYGPPTAPRPCFLDWMVANIRRGEGTLFTDEYRSPVFVEDLCRVIESACERRVSGLFHTGGPDRISRYDFGLLAAELFSLPAGNVRGASAADVALGALRPADVSLDVSKARRDLGYAPRTSREGLEVLARAGCYRAPEGAEAV